MQPIQSPQHSAHLEDGKLLSRLVHSIGLSTFLADCWDRRSVFLGQAAVAAGLVPMDPPAFKRAACRAEPGSIAASYRHKGGLAETVISPDELDFFFDGGMTINLRQAHLCDAYLARLTTALKAETGHAGDVEAFVFWSPRGTGLDWHFDTGGSFVVQMSGSKRWRFGKTPEIQSPPSPVLAVDAPDYHLFHEWAEIHPPEASKTAEVILNPGDVLYLPGGTWHTASATSESGSLAVTLGFSPEPLYRIVAARIETILQAKTHWRRTPTKAQPGDIEPRFRDELHEAVEAAAAAIDREVTVPVHSPNVNTVESPETFITQDTTLAPTDILRCVPGRDDLGKQCLVVSAGYAAINMTIDAMPFVDALLTAPREFPAGEATSWGERSREWNDVQPILEVLIRRGILQVVPRSHEVSRLSEG